MSMRARTRLGLALAVLVYLVCVSPVAVEGSLMYLYLRPKDRFCVAPENLPSTSGKEEKYMVHYGWMGDEDIRGSVTLSIKSGSIFGPVISRTLDVKDSAVVLELVTGPDYRFCFEYDGSRTRIPFEYHIGRAHDNPLVEAHEEEIDQYMDAVQGLEGNVAQIADEVEFLVGRQEEFEGTVRSTYFRIIIFTAISAAVVLGTAAWQIIALKSLFKAKKIV